MKVRIRGHLPYVTATLTFQGRKLELEHVVIDSGSAASVFSADEVAEVGIVPEHTDFLHRVRGVGGFEFVYSKRLDSLGVGPLQVDGFEIQVGALHYGFPLQGLIGTDFLLKTRAVIDYGALEIRRSSVKG